MPTDSAIDPHPRRFAVFSTDRSPSYLFLAPLTARLWNRIGYASLVTLAGPPHAWRHNPIQCLAAAELSRQHARLAHLPEIPGYATSSVAQLSRLYAATLDFPPDTYLLTADADMWPLSSDHFANLAPHKSVHVLYANAYPQTGPFPRFPICYLGASVDSWRAIMRTGKSDLSAALSDQLEFGLGSDPPAWRAWNYDEWLFGEMLESTPGYPGTCDFRARAGGAGKPPPDRLDRNHWRDPDTLAGLIDAHVLHPAYSAGNWPRLRRLLALALPPHEMQGVDAYHAAFVNAINP